MKGSSTQSAGSGIGVALDDERAAVLGGLGDIGIGEKYNNL